LYLKTSPANLCRIVFSVKNDLARLEIYDHDERTSIITEYVVLERVVLEDNHATVVLGRESDDYSQRVTDLASKLAEASATAYGDGGNSYRDK